MFKKAAFTLGMASLLFVAGCGEQSGNESSANELFSYTQDGADVAEWTSMETPGGGEGSVELGDDVAIIHAASDGWGGVQSDTISIDLSRDPLLFVRVKESGDDFKWGAKFVPSSPEIDEHNWGMYLIEDNNFKWNNYAVVDIKDKLGESFVHLYGEDLEGVIWLMASGSSEATVEISEVKIMYQK